MSDAFIFQNLDFLDAISDQLAQIYRRLCRGTGVAEYQTLLENIKSDKANADREYPKDVYSPHLHDSVIEVLLKDETNENGTDYEAVNDSMTDIIANLLGHLRQAVKNTTDLFRQNNLRNQSNSSLPEGDRVVGAMSLEDMLSIRTEQVAELKAVLNAHKEENELKIASLKRKYEIEKAIVSETMMNLRDELNALKKEKESLISLRSMFVTKYEKCISRLNELQLQLTASEKEINDLNSLMSDMCSAVAENSANHEDNSDEEINQLYSLMGGMCSAEAESSTKHEDKSE